jgi:hypothetical protein
LKDNERVHNQTEDDNIILFLHSKVDKLIEAGVILPPPIIRDYFHYSYEINAYLKKYIENPHRDATEEDKKNMIDKLFFRSSYVVKDLNVMLDYNLIPKSDYFNHYTHLINRLEKIDKETTKRLFDYWLNSGQINDTNYDTILDILNRKLERIRTSYGNNPPANNTILGTYYSKGIANYTYAIEIISNIQKKDRAKSVYEVLNTAGPDSQLYKLPKNVYSNIIKFNTGLNRRNYMEGGKKHRKSRKTKRGGKYTRKHRA